jgi:hypothetical protein
VCARQRLDNIFKPRRITQRNHMPSGTGMEHVSIPIAHHAPGPFDHGHQRRKIMQLQSSLDD